MASIRPAFLEVGPPYTPEIRLILKTRFTELTQQSLSWVFLYLSLKMNFQLQFWGTVPLENWVNTGTDLWSHSQHLNICFHPQVGCGVLVSLMAVWKVVEIFCLSTAIWNKIFLLSLIFFTFSLILVETEFPSLTFLWRPNHFTSWQ